MKINQALTHISNPKADPQNHYSEAMQAIITVADAEAACSDFQLWPKYCPTPLVELGGLAKHCAVGKISYKDESQRFGLKSFKALGGAYAVAKQLISHIESRTGQQVGVAELFDGAFSEIIGEVTITTATDGNHGRSVSWGCEMFGCTCVIYIHADVSVGREQNMKELGAQVIRIDGNYDDSVKQAASEAAENNWIVVSDNSYAGYMDIPKDVMRGYSVMLKETVEQLQGEIPTHVFVQGGCGGLAATVCGYFWDLWQANRPRIVIVEPEQANCLQLSCAHNELQVVDGKLDTLMAGLACGEVSLLAWEILETGCDDFTTVSEALVPKSMRVLAAGQAGDPQIEAGESAVAGVAALLATAGDEAARSCLGLNTNSHVLFFGTEGATDLELYRQLIGESD